jgi:hypothetical protein
MFFFIQKKKEWYASPKNKWKLQHKHSFIFFFCLILLSYLHTTLFQSSSFSPDPHGKIFKFFCQKPIQVLMSFDGMFWLSYALNGNGSFYDYLKKPLDLGIMKLMRTPINLKMSMKILHYYIIYKMGICQLEWCPRKRTKSYKKSKGWSGKVVYSKYNMMNILHPIQWVGLVWHAHEELRHFGVQRAHSLL